MTRPADDDGESTPTRDLLSMTAEERTCHDLGRLYGFQEDFDRGVAWADDRAAAVFGKAMSTVHAAAGWPVVDPASTRRRALEREARWTP